MNHTTKIPLSQEELAKKFAQSWLIQQQKNWEGKNGLRESYEFNKNYPIYSLDMTFNANQKREALYKIEYELNNHDLMILKTLSSFEEYFLQTWISHKSLAKAAGCSIRTVLNRLKYLVSLGFIATEFRCNRTSLYRVAPYLLQVRAVNLLARRTCMGIMVGLATLFSTLSAQKIVEEKVAIQAVDQYIDKSCVGVSLINENNEINMSLNKFKELQKEEDNYNYQEKPIERSFSKSYSSQPVGRVPSGTIKREEKGHAHAPLETLSHAQLQAELHKELNKELSFNSNPRNLVGPDMRRVKALKAELAKRDQANEDAPESKILTTDYFSHYDY